MRIDAELALLSMTSADVGELSELLPFGFKVEDCTDRGYGLIVRQLEDPQQSEVQSAIVALTSPLSDIASELVKHDPVVRVAIYFDTANCTIDLRPNDETFPFETNLEISVYPS